MQTILGANGIIADELVKELNKNFTTNIRLVSRKPVKVTDSDSLLAANLLDKKSTEVAVKGSEIAYLTVGLPMNTDVWVEQYPIIMRNVLDACIKYDVKLVYFDNTYMYPQNSSPLTEETEFAPVGKKGEVRAEITNMLLYEMESKNIDAVICRAPEFYGPGKTKSITNGLIFENIRYDKKLKVLLRDDTLRTLIWTPDAGKATALIGNSPEAYGETWHLPCDDSRLTYKQFIEKASKLIGNDLQYEVVNKFEVINEELIELLPRYEHDNIFNSSKFKRWFPEFKTTSYTEGIEQIIRKRNTFL